jgi:hypothetical protein
MRGCCMSHYRIYSLTRDGHIKTVPVLADCDDDQVAIARANAIKDDLDLEVWQGPRRVALLKGMSDK